MKNHSKLILSSLVLILTCGAGFLPFLRPHESSTADRSGFPGWPKQWRGELWHADLLTERELLHSRNFPGMVGRFRCGEKMIVVHWIARRTRHFHFSQYCLRGGGWEITKIANQPDSVGRLWACYLAERDGVTMKLRQRIEAANDPSVSFLDASRWFWSFMDDSAQPPFWAWTIVEAVPDEAGL